MFADLCYFPVRTIQITFVFLVLPCLMLGYMGQAAYLMDNYGDPQQAFFSSIPGEILHFGRNNFFKRFHPNQMSNSGIWCVCVQMEVFGGCF